MRTLQVLRSVLASIRLLPQVLALDTPGVQTTISQLRGVWGAALHDLDRTAYTRVFSPESRGGTPGYLLRATAPDPALAATAIHWFLLGPAVDHVEPLQRAWDIASGMGLGPQRCRFAIRRALVLGPDGAVTPRLTPWLLDNAAWPLSGNPASVPCRLVFPVPLRLLRHGQLLVQPTLVDLVAAASRRIGSFLTGAEAHVWANLRPALLDLARETPTTAWRGARLDLHRWSASQQAEIDLRGVAGTLALPAGPGALWPLLSAACWLHLGKGTTLGLGELRIESLHSAPVERESNPRCGQVALR